jgi:phosphate transport system protein
MTQMMNDSSLITRSTRLLSLGKYIERIGDHATNIAEMVVFMVRGEDVRHTGANES